MAISCLELILPSSLLQTTLLTHFSLAPVPDEVRGDATPWLMHKPPALHRQRSTCLALHQVAQFSPLLHDLMSGALLQRDPAARGSALSALRHPFFASSHPDHLQHSRPFSPHGPAVTQQALREVPMADSCSGKHFPTSCSGEVSNTMHLMSSSPGCAAPSQAPSQAHVSAYSQRYHSASCTPASSTSIHYVPEPSNELLHRTVRAACALETPSIPGDAQQQAAHQVAQLQEELDRAARSDHESQLEVGRLRAALALAQEDRNVTGQGAARPQKDSARLLSHRSVLSSGYPDPTVGTPTELERLQVEIRQLLQAAGTAEVERQWLAERVQKLSQGDPEGHQRDATAPLTSKRLGSRPRQAHGKVPEGDDSSGRLTEMRQMNEVSENQLGWVGGEKRARRAVE